jgi:hypothetical protein
MSAPSIQLESPHGFRERMVLFGGGGVGKTTAILTIARRITKGKLWIIDNDFSYAYERALQTDFKDVSPARVEVIEVGDSWQDMRDALDRVLLEGNPDEDWLIVDSISPTWDAVQSWYAQTVMNDTFAGYMTELRAKVNDMTEFNKILAADGRWQFINKEYFDGFYGPIRRWRGHMILTAEAKSLSSQADAEEKELYGFLGVAPVGQKRLKHIAHTNLYLAKPGQGSYVLTTVKDRNRAEQERLPINDFALDYLRGVAGWTVVRAAKAAE